MAVATAGVYLAFDGGPDASAPDGPGIGPYDEIVLRGARAVGERAGLGKVIALRSSSGSWRDAETSAAESDTADGGRGDLRISAGADDVLVRFSDDEVAGQAKVPDLGPYGTIVVGTHEVRGDEDTLAVRVSRISPWQLTDRAGSGFQGAMKDALVFVASARSATSQPRPDPIARDVPTGRPQAGVGAPDGAGAPGVGAPDGAGAPGVGAPDGVGAPAPDAPSGNGNPTAPAEDAEPSVWVERAKAAPNIYISRPDKKR